MRPKQGAPAQGVEGLRKQVEENCQQNGPKRKPGQLSSDNAPVEARNQPQEQPQAEERANPAYPERERAAFGGHELTPGRNTLLQIEKQSPRGTLRSAR